MDRLQARPKGGRVAKDEIADSQCLARTPLAQGERRSPLKRGPVLPTSMTAIRFYVPEGIDKLIGVIMCPRRVDIAAGGLVRNRARLGSGRVFSPALVLRSWPLPRYPLL